MTQNGSGPRGCDYRGTVIGNREFFPLSGSALIIETCGPDTAGAFLRPTQREKTDLEAWKKAVARPPLPRDDADDPPQRSVSTVT